MDDSERKELVWKIKKDFHALSAEELFQVIERVTPVEDLDPSAVIQGDEESCYDYICTYVNCKTLLDSKDQGFSHLLVLRAAIGELITSHTVEVSQPAMSCTENRSMAATASPTTPRVSEQGNVDRNVVDAYSVDGADSEASEY